MSLYLILDIAVIFIPLVLSFDRRVAFYRRWPSAFSSIVIVGAIFVAWDVFATRRGDWHFSGIHTMGIRLWGLPVEEVAFFVAVPYAWLFIYEVVRAFVPERGTFMPPWLAAIVGVLAVATGLSFYTQPYTLTVLVVFGSIFLVSAAIAPHMLTSSWFWIALGICYVPFVIANGVLTAIPVVSYHAGHIWSVRIFTIPIENFFYGFALLSANFLVHIFLRSRFAGRNVPVVPV